MNRIERLAELVESYWQSQRQGNWKHKAASLAPFTLTRVAPELIAVVQAAKRLRILVGKDCEPRRALAGEVAAWNCLEDALANLDVKLAEMLRGNPGRGKS